MDEKPKRRWLRFRLSTVLILTAILAWGMACRPFLEFLASGVDVALGDSDRPGWQSGIGGDDQHGSPDWLIGVRIGPRPSFAYPLVALAAFLAWKAAWAVIERRRRPSAAPE